MTAKIAVTTPMPSASVKMVMPVEIVEQHFLHASADVEPRAQCNRQPGLTSRGRRVVAAGGLLTCSTDGQAHSDESAAPGRTERLARFDGESAVVSHSCLIEGLSH